MQFRSAYYLYAIIFLIFDVEAVFLLPFAVAFTGLGVGASRFAGNVMLDLRCLEDEAAFLSQLDDLPAATP